MSLWRKKKTEPPKTLEQCMSEIVALGTDGLSFSCIYGTSQVDYLMGYSWVKLDNHMLLVSADLYPHVARIYEAQRNTFADNKNDKLKKENETLKKKVAELTAEVERLSQPTGRKILVDQKESA